MVTVATSNSASTGWLRNPAFDLFFIVGIAAVALASGGLVIWNNDLFLPVLAADLWFLGYHHVIATYTRLSFDSESFAENKGLILYLFPAVAVVVFSIVVTFSLWVIPTVYLYWQWWHYTRQSEGISKAYAGKSRDRQLGDPRIRRAAFYAVPIAGILAVSNRAPGNFLYFPLKTLPVPDAVLQTVYIVAAVLVLLWLADQARAWASGKLSIPYFLYVMSHFTIYFFAYILVAELDYGWLIVNIWHNAQYILFVWLYNNRRFGGAVSKNHLFLSTISQNGRLALYIATCLTISTVVYFLITSFLADAMASTLAITSTMIALVIYQTINFHHYIVDSLIWKLRKKRFKANLGLS